MSKSIRVRTTPNGDDKYIKVELKQDFDFLEILSLKLKQEDAYQNFCSNYGVVAGRISVNNGFGLPNAKVSIFIPITSEDSQNEIIRTLYPYESPQPQDKNEQGIRYNLLPNQQQSFDHTPVGTFPTKLEILDNNTTLNIHEKYYKYTTTTNEAGDFILFGIPVGDQLLHYDIDWSDVGFLSLRPYDLIERGFNKNLFLSPFKFSSSPNLDNLPQLVGQNVNVSVEPFWCDDLSTGRVVGITRKDIAITTMDLTPSATFFGSAFSDDEKDSLNKNCRPRRKTGRLAEVITTSGKIEAIRRTVEGSIEKYDISDDAMDENGNWAMQLPMNIRKVITDEFGNLIPSPDGVSGIATEGDYRFRISMDKTDNDNKKRQRGKFLVPNMSDNFIFNTYSLGDAPFPFAINQQLSTATVGTPYSADTTNQYNYLEDFFSFRWKKVYTTRQFIGRYAKQTNDGKRKFTGIKDIEKAEGVNKFPSNRIDGQVHPLYSFFVFLLTILGMIFALINWLIILINSIITLLCDLKLPVGLCIEAPSCSTCAKKIKCRKSSTNSELMKTCCVGHLENCKDAWGFSTGQSGVPSSTYPGYGYMIKPGSAWSCSSAPAGTLNTNYFPITAAGCESAWGTDYDELDTDINLDQYETSDCDASCDGILIKVGTFCKCISIQLKFKCLFAGIFCKKCQPLCPGNEPFSCCGCGDFGCDGDCNEGECASEVDDNNCCDDCCITIPLIELTCAEDASFQNITPYIIGTPFSPRKCNSQLIKGYCRDCSGIGIPFISGWIACKLEGMAAFLGMLKFDFYNDWINGSLYFPLIKRKTKVKKKGRKAGQIKYDKFCDFDCDDFQSDSKTCYLMSVTNTGTSDQTFKVKKHGGKNQNFSPQSSQWCEVTIKAGDTKTGTGNNTADDPNNSLYRCSLDNKNSSIKDTRKSAYESLKLYGTDENGNTCYFSFLACFKSNDSGPTYPSAFNDFASNSFLAFDKSTFQDPSEHDKPFYVEVEDPLTGIKYQKNYGGHGHHKNKCNNVYRGERLEYWQENGSCAGTTYDADGNLQGTGIGTTEIADREVGPCGGQASQCVIGACTWGACRCKANNPACSSEDPNPCCNCNPRSNKNNILHGIIKEKDGVLYYASINNRFQEVSPGGTGLTNITYNSIKSQYKSNLLFPTNICEVGSSVFCDIDEAPFIIDQLVPTTFSISEESEKFKEGGQGSQAGTFNDPIMLESKERNSSNINIGAYVSFGMIGVKCLNTQATVTQSQIGVDTIDKTDLDMEIGKCMMWFDHDEDIREYFCRRFSGYKNKDLDVHYQRPGSTQYDNVYNTYPEVNPTVGDNYYQIDGGATQQGTINDGDSIIPGDRCGIQYSSYTYTNSLTPYGNTVANQIGDIDYFYGVAPGVTTNDGALSPIFPTYGGGANAYGLGNYCQNLSPSINIDSSSNGGQERRGINFGTSQTPYYFYFGILPGKTALHKVVAKYFADKIDKITLGKLTGEKRNNQSNFKNVVKNPLTLYKSCLGESLKSTE